MIRQSVTINNFPYIVDLFKGGTSDIKEHHYAKFVFIRRYEFSTNIARDTDIYVMQKDMYDKYLQGEFELTFPVPNNKFVSFSKNFSKFNENFSDLTFKTNKTDIYELYELSDTGNFVETELLLDKIRIYHPDNIFDLNGILYCDSYIGDIHFHWFAQPITQIVDLNKTKADQDFTVNNFKYAEYVECWVPSPEQIINRNVYFKENLNLTDIKDNDVYWVGDELITTSAGKPVQSDKTDDLFNTERANTFYTDWNLDLLGLIYSPIKPTRNKDTFVSMYCFNLPYICETLENGQVKKKYIPSNAKSIVNNYTTHPMRITLWMSSEYASSIDMYLPSTEYTTNSDMFFTTVEFGLSSKFGFDESGTVSLQNMFTYPSKDNFKSFRDAYKYYFNVDLRDYEGIVDENNEDEDLKQCGFELKIYTDYKKKNCVFTTYFEIDKPDQELDDFSFQMTNIFDSWDQYCDILLCECTFTDKYLGNIIKGNCVLITKEWYKYMLVKDEKGIVTFDGKQDTGIYEKRDMDLGKFNFIDKISCNIVKQNANIQQPVTTITKNEPRVIWKPVFFKVQDLQNIKIRQGLKQNIGINLSQYMSKVDTFKLIIDNKEIVESARNDIYVIFNINALAISATSGTYHILNQDDEYISSGNWTIY